MSQAHDRVRRRLAAYALGALEGDELEEVEQHLELCAECREDVAQAREAAASLVEPGAVAPADVWERVAQAIRDPLRKRPWQKQRRDGSW